MAHAEQYGYGDVMQSSMGISYRAVWGYHAEQYGDMQSSMGRVNIEQYVSCHAEQYGDGLQSSMVMSCRAVQGGST